MSALRELRAVHWVAFGGAFFAFALLVFGGTISARPPITAAAHKVNALCGGHHGVENWRQGNGHTVLATCRDGYATSGDY